MAKITPDGKTYYYGTDNLGSTTVLFDEEGNAVWKGEISAFGDVVLGEWIGEELFDERVRFTGKDYDEVTGLYYFNARWYDPQLGRFTSEDPIRDGINWHVYTYNNPLKYTDPTGLDPHHMTPEEADTKAWSDPSSGSKTQKEVIQDLKEKKKQALKQATSYAEKQLIRAHFNYERANIATTKFGKAWYTGLGNNTLEAGIAGIHRTLKTGGYVDDATLNALVDVSVIRRGGGTLRAPPSPAVIYTLLSVFEAQSPSVTLGSLGGDMSALARLYQQDWDVRRAFYRGDKALGIIDTMSEQTLTGYLSGLTVFLDANMGMLGRLAGISNTTPTALSFGSYIFTSLTGASFTGPGSGENMRLMGHETVHSLQAHGIGSMEEFTRKYYDALNRSRRRQSNLDLAYKHSYYEIEAYAVRDALYQKGWP